MWSNSAQRWCRAEEFANPLRSLFVNVFQTLKKKRKLFLPSLFSSLPLRETKNESDAEVRRLRGERGHGGHGEDPQRLRGGLLRAGPKVRNPQNEETEERDGRGIWEILNTFGAFGR